MTPYRRKLILSRVLDPRYEHPKSMRWSIRIKRILKRFYPDGTKALILTSSPIMEMVKRSHCTPPQDAAR